MKIDYYHFADCARFRVPAIDVLAVGQDLTAILVQSFDQGIPADYALQQVLNNPSVVNNLVSQVAENLDFQRQNALERVNQETQDEVSEYQQEQKSRMQRIDEYLKPTIIQKKSEYDQKQKKVEEKTGYYSAAHRSLEEMRAKVQQRLAEVGGIEGYQKIEQISASLQQSKPGLYTQLDPSVISGTVPDNQYQPKPADQELTKKKKKKKKDLQKALAIATSKKSIDPLRDQASLDDLVKEDSSADEDERLESMLEQPKRESAWKRFWKKVKEVANYKIW